MTKYRDVNKCRRKEKCKMAALIRQANKRVRNGQRYIKYKIKKIEEEEEITHGGKEKEKREKQTKTPSEKKDEARNVSELRDKGWIHVIRVHDTIHSADNTAGQLTLTNYPTQRNRDYPLTRTS